MIIIGRLFTNWKTTGMGVSLLATALVDVAFMIVEGKPVTKPEVLTPVIAILGGIGMLAAGDADKSQSKEEAKRDAKEAMEDTKTMLRGKADVEDK